MPNFTPIMKFNFRGRSAPGPPVDLTVLRRHIAGFFVREKRVNEKGRGGNERMVRPQSNSVFCTLTTM